MTLEAFEEVSDRTRKVTREIKLIYSGFFSKQSGNKVYFKPEDSQQIGAYKVCGAYYKVSTMDENAREKDLITASAGGHVQGVVFAAKLTGVRATVCMPMATPLVKVNRTKAFGVEVVLSDDVFDDALERACEITAETGATFVHPFGDLTVATGQGSIMIEVVKELPTVDYILMPVGDDGLASGVSTLTRLLNPNIHVIGVEPESTACIKASLATGEVVTLPSADAVADGIAAKQPDEKIFPYIQKNLDGIITIQDNELIVSFLDVVESHKMIVGNSGLLTVAALKHLDVENKKTVSILSGDNMDVITMASLAQHGLIQRDRIFTVSVLLPDKPGQPARVAEVIAEENGNVIRLERNRFVSINRSAMMELRTTMEAFGIEHKEEICERLKEEGCHPKLVRSKRTYGE